MSIEDSGGALKEGLFTNSLPNDKPPQLSYRISSGVDGIFHSFIENEPSVLPSPLPSASSPPSEPVDEEFVDCSSGCPNGAYLFVKHDPCGKVRTYHIGCNSRFESVCSICARKWVKKKRHKIERLIANMRAPKLITLTLKKNRLTGNCDSLFDIHAMQNDLFHALRYRKFWIGPWVAVIEFPNHVHLIVDCDYIPQNQLSQYWKNASGGSYIVDIRPINIQRDGVGPSVKYITKYITKACGFTPCDVQQDLHGDGSPIPNNWSLDELRGFHIVQTWGNPSDSSIVVSCSCGDPSPWHKISFEFLLSDSERQYSMMTSDKGPPVLVPSLIVLPSSSRICGPCSDCSKSLLECSLRDWPLHDGYGLSS